MLGGKIEDLEKAHRTTLSLVRTKVHSLRSRTTRPKRQFTLRTRSKVYFRFVGKTQSILKESFLLQVGDLGPVSLLATSTHHERGRPSLASLQR
jgi:hypothetical protein